MATCWFGQGDACCAIVNISQDEVGKKKVNELGRFAHHEHPWTEVKGTPVANVWQMFHDSFKNHSGHLTWLAGEGGFQQMLQSQKRFEFNPEFWEMRWGMKELKEGDTVMAAWLNLLRRWTASIDNLDGQRFDRFSVSHHFSIFAMALVRVGQSFDLQRSTIAVGAAGWLELSPESTGAMEPTMSHTCMEAMIARCPTIWSGQKTSQTHSCRWEGQGF